MLLRTELELEKIAKEFRHAICIITDKAEKYVLPVIASTNNTKWSPKNQAQAIYNRIYKILSSSSNIIFILNYEIQKTCLWCPNQFYDLLNACEGNKYAWNTKIKKICIQNFVFTIHKSYHTFKTQKNPPEFPKTPLGICSFLGLGSRWIALARQTQYKEQQYNVFTIPKKNGKTREICAPKMPLKAALRQVLHRLLDPIELNESVGAFVKNRNIRQVAEHHMQKAVIIKIDIKDFFPSIKVGLIKRTLQHYGFTPSVSRMLAHLVTHKRKLPQGAPTSGFLANMVAEYCFDLEIKKFLATLDSQWRYDRYADDLIISHPVWQKKETILEIVRTIKTILRKSGFKINPDKVSIASTNRSQRVLGFTVNKKVNIPRQKFQRIKAILHNVAKNGLEKEAQKSKLDKERFYQKLQGWVAFIRHNFPEKFNKIKKDWEACCASYKTLSVNIINNNL